MFQKTLLILAIAAACTSVQAQSTPAKKELAARILKAQQPGIDQLARGLVEEPALEIMARASAALPARVAADRREAVAKDIQADARRFVEETTPIVRDRAARLAPSTVGALLEEKFTEDELKQIVTMLESPVFAKFQQLGGDMQKVLAEKVVAETRPQVEPRVRALEEGIARRLGVTPNAAGSGAGAAPAAAAPAGPKPPPKK
jgi:hypothetical protein